MSLDGKVAVTPCTQMKLREANLINTALTGSTGQGRKHSESRNHEVFSLYRLKAEKALSAIPAIFMGRTILERSVDSPTN